MKVNERRTVVGGLIGHCVSPPTVERDRRAWCLTVICMSRQRRQRCAFSVLNKRLAVSHREDTVSALLLRLLYNKQRCRHAMCRHVCGRPSSAHCTPVYIGAAHRFSLPDCASSHWVHSLRLDFFVRHCLVCACMLCYCNMVR